MSNVAIAVTVTFHTALTASTLPGNAGAATRTIAATDRAITDLAEATRRKVRDLFQAIDPNADANTTVAVTVT